jgi:hypothetical protein
MKFIYSSGSNRCKMYWQFYRLLLRDLGMKKQNCVAVGWCPIIFPFPCLVFKVYPHFFAHCDQVRMLAMTNTVRVFVCSEKRYVELFLNVSPPNVRPARGGFSGQSGFSGNVEINVYFS